MAVHARPPAVVHPSAVVESGAVLASGVRIGPMCYVGADVELGPDTELMAQATVLGPARLGANNRLHPHVVLGDAPQDRSWAGEPTTLWIGDDNTFREHVTVHRGTLKGGGATRVGSRCLLMAGAHVAHDCDLDDDVVLTNHVVLGGHVLIQQAAVCGGHAAIAPFVRLGRACFVAGGARVERDVPPFLIVAGDRARVRALNRVGLQRMGVPSASRRVLKQAFRGLWRSGHPLEQSCRSVRAELGADPYVEQLVAFVMETAAR